MISRRMLLQLGAALPVLPATRPARAKSQTGRDVPGVPALGFGPLEVLAAGNGLRIGRQDWSLDREAGVAWRVAARRDAMLSVLASGRVGSLSTLLPSVAGPWAAINGGFYDRDGRAMGVVIADGILHAPYRRGGGSGIVQVTAAGVEIVHHSAFSPEATNALQSIDRIVSDSRSLVNPRPTARASARSAIALTPEEIVLVLAASNRSITGIGDDITLGLVSGYGLPLWAFSRYLVDAIGAESALNLDGGVSAQLAAKTDGREIRVRALGGTINGLLLRPRSSVVDDRQ